jgi:hypothetical protein
MEIPMKTVLFISAGMLCTCAWHANAQAPDATQPTQPTQAQAQVQGNADTSEGPDLSGNSMSGPPAAIHGKTRDEVYQDLVRSQKNGEAERLRQLFSGS